MARPNAFRPHEHLRRRDDFQRLFDDRCTVSDDRLVIFGCRNELAYIRVGFAVSRKVGPAVVRNRFRRIYREAFRLTRRELPTGLDMILLPRSPAQPKRAEIQESLRRLVPQLDERLRRREEKR